MGKGVATKANFKCDYCKATFENFEDGASHHQNSRHKKKEIKIVPIDQDDSLKRPNYDSEDIDEDVDFEPEKDDKEKLESRRKKIKTGSNRGGRRGRRSVSNAPNSVVVEIPVALPERRSTPGRQPTVHEIPKSFDLPDKTNGDLFYKCIECENWFDTFDELKSHQLGQHGSEDIEPHISMSKEGEAMELESLATFFCPKCDFQTYTVEEIKVHRLDHDDKNSAIIWYIKLEPGSTQPQLVEEATYVCTQCDIMPDTLRIMTSHWESRHSNLPLKVSRVYFKQPPQDNECNICNRKFSFINHLKVHQKYSH